MRHVAAYLLAVLGGKESPTAADIEKILSSVGIEADSEKVKKVIGELSGKKIDDIIEEGKYNFPSQRYQSLSPPIFTKYKLIKISTCFFFNASIFREINERKIAQ